MLKKFDENEKKFILELFESAKFYNGSIVTINNVKTIVEYNEELAMNVLTSKIEIKDISEGDYKKLLFALESTIDFYRSVTGEKRKEADKLMQIIKESRY